MLPPKGTELNGREWRPLREGRYEWVSEAKKRQRKIRKFFFFLLNEESKNLLWNKNNIRVNYVFGLYPLHYNSI